MKMLAHGRDGLLCLLSGVLTFASFPTALAPEYSFWPLIWISHIPILWVLKDKDPRSAFWWGLACGSIINAGGYYWIADMLQTFGHLHWSLAGLGMLILAVYQGLVWAVWAWAINRIGNTTSMPIEWSVPLVMVAVEFLIPRIFPAYMGNSQYLFLPIMQIADIFGVTAVTFLVYRVNANLFLWFRAWSEGRPRPVRATVITVVMLVGTLGYGLARMHQFDVRSAEAKSLKIGVVEGDVGIFQREDKDKIRNHLLIQQNLSAQAEAENVDLVVWSESSYRRGSLPRESKRFPPSPKPLVDDWSKDKGLSVHDRLAPQRGFSTPLLFGSTSVEMGDNPRFKGGSKRIPRNTAWLLDGDGTVAGVYDKVYLLVFGEYVPFVEYMPWFYDLVPAAGNLEPGDKLNVIEADLWDKGPVRLGILVCYEGILPAFARQFAKERPHVFFNLTNDDWFGKTAERYLHFILTIPRAIEHRVAFVRSTLTGVSAFIDPVGRINKMTRVDDPEVLVHTVPLLQSMTVYQVIGDVFPWGCSALMLLLLAWGGWRRR